MRKKIAAKQTKHNFFCYQKVVMIFIFCSIIVSLVELIHKNGTKNALFTNYTIFTSLRNLNRLYYHMVSSIMSVTCLSIDGKECKKYFNLYNQRFNIGDINMNFTLNNIL